MRRSMTNDRPVILSPKKSRWCCGLGLHVRPLSLPGQGLSITLLACQAPEALQAVQKLVEHSREQPLIQSEKQEAQSWAQETQLLLAV